MSVTRDTSQSGRSTQPAPRHRAVAGIVAPRVRRAALLAAGVPRRGTRPPRASASSGSPRVGRAKGNPPRQRWCRQRTSAHRRVCNRCRTWAGTSSRSPACRCSCRGRRWWERWTRRWRSRCFRCVDNRGELGAVARGGDATPVLRSCLGDPICSRIGGGPDVSVVHSRGELGAVARGGDAMPVCEVARETQFAPESVEVQMFPLR